MPGLVTLFWMLRFSLNQAFLEALLPATILLPMAFRLEINGLPDVTFFQTAVLPIGIVVLMRYGLKWRWSFSDVLMFGYMGCAFYSDFSRTNLGDGIASFFDITTVAFFPYVFGKAMIEQSNLRVKTLRMLVLLMAAVAFFSLYEFRFATNPIRDMWAPFFTPYQNVWTTQVRWGFGRVAGPFSHAILAGIVFSCGLLMNLWLARFGYWERKFKFMPGLPFRKSTVLTIVLAAGVAMTLSRGPWIGLGLGLIPVWAGMSRNLKRNARWAAIVCLVGGVGIFTYVMQYAEAGRKEGMTQEQENAAYRAELIDNYMPIIEKGGLFGWGHVAPPKVAGQSSIDNHYLFLALIQGYLGAGFFIASMVVAIGSLVWSGFRCQSKEERAFRFCLVGVLGSIAVSVTTVYLAAQAYVLFYLCVGWAEGLRTVRVTAPAPARQDAAELAPLHHMPRVIA
jgi:hypothetical protein